MFLEKKEEPRRCRIPSPEYKNEIYKNAEKNKKIKTLCRRRRKRSITKKDGEKDFIFFFCFTGHYCSYCVFSSGD